MLSKTHLAIGLASTITILAPDTAQELCPVIVGASWGSIICDIDCKFSKSKDAVLGRSIAGVLTAGAMYEDAVSNGPMFSFWQKAPIIPLVIATIVFLITAYFARESEHRFFSHSLIAFALFAGSIFFICRPVVLPFILGYASHLILDMLNFRPVHSLYPMKKGYSIKWRKAKSRANTVIMAIGCIWLIGVCALYAPKWIDTFSANQIVNTEVAR